MIHQIQEVGFIRSMVHTRAMMVIIDGLNEVSADTREKVGAFARDMSRGNVLIGTQPIEWLPPKGAQVVDLMPLDRAEALRFLLTRPVGRDASQNRHGMAYADAVAAFVDHALDEAPTEDDRRAATLMLSNPFDLSFAADLLAQRRGFVDPSPLAQKSRILRRTKMCFICATAPARHWHGRDEN
jgi:hypothetical protein